MKKLLAILALTAAAAPSALAQKYAVYQKVITGTETASFSATIGRIPPTFKSKRVTSTFLVIRNLTTLKELHINTFTLGRQKYYNLPVLSASDIRTVQMQDMPTQNKFRILGSDAKRVFELTRSVDVAPAAYVTDQKRPDARREEVRSYLGLSPTSITLRVQNMGSYQGVTTDTFLPKSSFSINAPRVLTGSGFDWEVFDGQDTAAPIFTDFQSNDIYTYPYTASMKINTALSDACSSGTPVLYSTSITLNPGTDGYAAYYISEIYLGGQGYELAP